MSLYIVKAKKTKLKSNLSPTAMSLVLDELVDSQDNPISMASFGEWFVLVLKNSSSIEMIKCDGVTQNLNGSATVDVATNGRNLLPITPYTGAATGATFLAGTEVIVTNDPLTVMSFGNLMNDNTWDGENIFAVVPKTTGGNAVDTNDLVRYGQALSLLAGIATSIATVVPGTAGETLAAGDSVYLKSSDNRWWKTDADISSTVENVILGMAQGSGTAGNAINSGVMLRGVDTHQTGLTAGNLIYASNTAGGVSPTPGTKEVTLGIAKSATELYFDPRFNQQLTEDQQDGLDAANPALSTTNPAVGENYRGFSPVGMVSPFAGSSAPTGWLLCDGSAVSRTTYAALFAVVGTSFGPGDGSTTFNLPNMRGRSVIGVGAGTKVATFSSRSGNVITVTGLTNAANNEFQTGQAVVYNTSGSVITGLTNATTYYVVRVTDTTFSLATSLANAIAGTVISLSSNGSGTQTFTQTLTTRTLGDTGGEENHANTLDEVPGTLLKQRTSAPITMDAGQNSPSVPTTQSNSPGNLAHNNMSPFVALNYIIKT